MQKYNQQSYKKAENYVTYPRTFESYRWYKPIIESVIIILVYLVAATILVAINLVPQFMNDTADLSSFQNGYDGMDAFTPSGAIMTLGSLAIMIPIIWLALKITKSRPFSSLSSSRGNGWSGKVFKKCLLVAVIVNGIPNLIIALIYNQKGDVRFTIAGFIICVILVPLQCMAEEYFFRGFLMQTFGSWFKLPVLAIILQTVCFACLHPYNIYGVITIFIDGIGMGVAAYLSKGLEASSALHIVNNMLAFMMAGFGVSAITSEVDVSSIVLALCINVVYVLVLAALGGLLGWFEPEQDQQVQQNA